MICSLLSNIKKKNTHDSELFGGSVKYKQTPAALMEADLRI